MTIRISENGNVLLVRRLLILCRFAAHNRFEIADAIANLEQSGLLLADKKQKLLQILADFRRVSIAKYDVRNFSDEKTRKQEQPWFPNLTLIGSPTTLPTQDLYRNLAVDLWEVKDTAWHF